MLSDPLFPTLEDDLAARLGQFAGKSVGLETVVDALDGLTALALGYMRWDSSALGVTPDAQVLPKRALDALRVLCRTFDVTVITPAYDAEVSLLLMPLIDDFGVMTIAARKARQTTA